MKKNSYLNYYYTTTIDDRHRLVHYYYYCFTTEYNYIIMLSTVTKSHMHYDVLLFNLTADLEGYRLIYRRRYDPIIML